MKKLIAFFGILALCVAFYSQNVTAGDGVTRIYASTQMNGCAEKDIVMGNGVWASCNSDYQLANSKYYQGNSKDSIDINGWKQGRLYRTNDVSCPAGYKVPTLVEFQDVFSDRNNIAKLALPAAGTFAYNKDQHKDIKGFYWVGGEHNTFVWYQVEPYKSAQGGYGQDYGYASLRCIRITPATDEEKGITHATNTAENNAPTKTLHSTDTYVNEKLSEMNACFLDSYNSHLATLDAALKKLNDDLKKQTDPVQKRKYERAIERVTEMKTLFIRRYEMILELSGSANKPGIGIQTGNTLR